MVKHIVFWRLQEQAEGHTKAENAQIIKEGLEGLVGRIPGLLSAEVGFALADEGYDLCLVCAFEDEAALAVYQDHPEHDKVRQYVRKTTQARACVDYKAD